MQCSKDTVCGICMKVACEKASTGERGFGILSSCSHTYCPKCIHKWKGTKLFESKIVVSYPECRITSSFVIPSEYQEFIEERENNDPFDNNEEEIVTFELGEMLLMLVADGDDELTDFENEWDLFHVDLEDFYDLAQ
ncbi:hypothetical protein H8959_022257 [Pygathrix nigripes]